MNFTKSANFESIEQTMRSLKLGGLAKEWRGVEFRGNEQYMRELLDIEVKEREANRSEPDGHYLGATPSGVVGPASRWLKFRQA